jgi:hypothetical protein
VKGEIGRVTCGATISFVSGFETDPRVVVNGVQLAVFSTSRPSRANSFFHLPKL